MSKVWYAAMRWGDISKMGDKFRVNPVVNPLEDLRLKLIQIREAYNCKDDKLKVAMNPTTTQLIAQNPNVIAYVCTYIKDHKDLVDNTYGLTTPLLLEHELNLDVTINNEVESIDDVARYVLPDYLIKIGDLCTIDVRGGHNEIRLQ